MQRIISAATLLLLATGCSSSPQIVYEGTAAYDKRVATLAIKPQQAQEIAGKTDRAPGAGPAALVDHWYLFDKPRKYAMIRLDGVYVSGNTGEAQYRQSSEALNSSFLGSFFGSYPNDMPKRLPPNPYKQIEALSPAIAASAAPSAESPPSSPPPSPTAPARN
jgi:hypothetical protein